MAINVRTKPDLRILTRILTSPSPFHRRPWRFFETLAFEELRSSVDGPPKFTAFVLHGLLGSGRNWRSFSRALASSLFSSSPSSDWNMIVVDLRNHGKSAELRSLHPPHDLISAASDLANLVRSEGWTWPDVVMGHSMGGKVALQYALSCARGDYGDAVKLPKQLWVLDSVPGKVEHENSDGEVERVLQTLQGLPSYIPSRKWLVDHFQNLGFSKSLSEWMGSNLKRSGERETWVFNLEGAVQMFNSYRELDFWPLLEHPPEGMEIIIVRAEKSDRWNPDVIRRLEMIGSRSQERSKGIVSVHVLPDSGHWVHVDNPKGLLEIVTPKIASLV